MVTVAFNIRKTYDVNVAAMASLCWRVKRNREQPWAKMLTHKYVDEEASFSK